MEKKDNSDSDSDIIVIAGCDDPNCGNNRNRNKNKPNEKEQASITQFYGQGSGTNPFEDSKKKKIQRIRDNPQLPKVLDDLDDSPTSPPGSSSSDDDGSSSSGDSDQENRPPHTPDYLFVQGIINNFQYFMMESVKDGFEKLIQLMRLFHYACVYYDVLGFFYSAEELLSLDSVTITQHFRICEQLKNFMDIRFKDQLILFLRILKELLEEEREEYQDQRFNININVYLSLGTLENTNFFIRKIRNLLRNGRHLRYPSMTWHDRLVCLLEDLKRLNQTETHIHLTEQPYTRPEFEEYTHFSRFTLLNDEEWQRLPRENSPEY